MAITQRKNQPNKYKKNEFNRRIHVNYLQIEDMTQEVQMFYATAYNKTQLLGICLTTVHYHQLEKKKEDERLRRL